MITTLTKENTLTFSKEEFLKKGKELINTNSFYFTLHLLLRYYFQKKQDFYLMDFIKDVTNTENEFKVFMVYIEFALYVYNSKLKDMLCEHENSEDIVYILVSYIKDLYDRDHSILKPFINSISENEHEIIEKFNIVKSAYNFKLEALEKFEKLNKAISYLEKSKEHENEARKFSNMALEVLQDLKGKFRKTIYNEDQAKLIIKNL